MCGIFMLNKGIALKHNMSVRECVNAVDFRA